MNIFIISYDCLRADYLECAPFLTSLKQIYFPNAVTISPQSRVSISALLTGMHPRNNGIDAYSDMKGINVPVETCVPTLAEILGKRGYHTIGFGAWEFRPDIVPKQGFQKFFTGAGSVNSFIREYKQLPELKFGFFHFPNLHERLAGGVPKEEKYEKALRNSDKDFEVFFRQLNLDLPRTLVVIVGDHGIRINSEDGEKFYGITLKEETTRVFLSLLFPLSIEKKINALVSCMDIVPSILDISKIQCSREFDGESLVPLIVSEVLEYDRELLLLTGSMLESPHKPNVFAYRNSEFKLVFQSNKMIFDLYRISGNREELLDPEGNLELLRSFQKKLLRLLKAYNLLHLITEEKL